MNAIKKIWNQLDYQLWGLSILFGMLLPLFADKIHLIHRTWMVGLFLLIINTLFAVWLGHYLQSRNARWWTLFVFPVLFLIIAFAFLPHYTWYFALFYLGVTYLSWSMNRH